MILKIGIWLGCSGIVVGAFTMCVLAAQGQVAWLIYVAAACLVLVFTVRHWCQRLHRWASEFNPRHVDAEWRRTHPRI